MCEQMLKYMYETITIRGQFIHEKNKAEELNRLQCIWPCGRKIHGIQALTSNKIKRE